MNEATSTPWNHSIIALAKERCVTCGGYGQWKTQSLGHTRICQCVYLAIFRACHSKFRFIIENQRHISPVHYERVQGAQYRAMYGRKNEEFVADFLLIAKRTLNAEEHRLFKWRFLLGADWSLCARRLGINRNRQPFFHLIYAIEAKLGRAYRETRPYALFPLDEYFGGVVTVDRVRPIEAPEDKVSPVRAPVAA